MPVCKKCGLELVQGICESCNSIEFNQLNESRSSKMEKFKIGGMGCLVGIGFGGLSAILIIVGILHMTSTYLEYGNFPSGYLDEVISTRKFMLVSLIIYGTVCGGLTYFILKKLHRTYAKNIIIGTLCVIAIPLYFFISLLNTLYTLK